LPFANPKETTMAEFSTLTSTAVPLRAENVDTDQIIPAKYLTAISKAGMSDGLFSSWRYNLDGGSPNPSFVLNRQEFKGAQILLAGTNFGSGSSREHAVWALTEYGFRSVITPKFADIFYNNSLKNGLLPVALPEEVVNQLLETVEKTPSFKITVDLPSQTVSLETGESYSFEIDPFRKVCLLEGVDDLGYIQKKDDAISSFEAKRLY
jgi:3-isopropylmalate/(R)-2-methylmalate dehydratase small subunit